MQRIAAIIEDVRSAADFIVAAAFIGDAPLIEDTASYSAHAVAVL